MEKLSTNFSLSELTASQVAVRRGIDNTPGQKELEKLKKLAQDVLQPIRDAYGKPIIVTSGFRCEALNKAVSGANNSQHKFGEAADIKALDGDHASLFKIIQGMIKEGKIQVGQLIWEYGNKKQPGWIHVSLPRLGKANNQVLWIS